MLDSPNKFCLRLFLQCWGGSHDVHVRPPHETLGEESSESTDSYSRLREPVLSEELPPSYVSHTLVALVGIVFDPQAIYVGGSHNIKRDCILGCVVAHRLACMLHLCAVMWKSAVCRCGCAGRRYLWAIWNVCRWSVAYLKLGRLPETPRAGFVWEDDDERAQRAGD